MIWNNTVLLLMALLALEKAVFQNKLQKYLETK